MKWEQSPYPGVRFRKHPTRKNGVQFDRYFAIRYQRDGQRVEEALGWASTDGWTAAKAAEELSRLKRAARTGTGSTTLSERREKVRQKKSAEKKAALTFGKIFTEKYYPQAVQDKDRQSYSRELGIFTRWLEPTIGKLSLGDIAPIHLEKIKKLLRDAGKSPRSIQYALAVIRQVFNFAIRNGLFDGKSPTKSVKFPRADNRRARFLTPDEAEKLLAKLKKESLITWEMALLSLHTGMRAGEILRLTWGDIDAGNNLIAVKDTKSGRNRFAYMTEAVKDMLLEKDPGAASALLYPAPSGGIRHSVPGAFKRVVANLKLNDGITDRRDKVVFHTLRHTYASWLVQAGESIYTVKERLGHSTLAMTERYSHLAPENQQRTVKTLEGFMAQKDKTNDSEVLENKVSRTVGQG